MRISGRLAVYQIVPRVFSADVPIFIEDARVIGDGLPLVRCGYFTIERDEPAPGWTLEFRTELVPFHLVHLVGIITEPIGAPRFHTKELIDHLFETLEKDEAVSVDTSDIWVPRFVLSGELHSGDVYRMAGATFTAAYRFRQGSLGQDLFEKHCLEHKDDVRYSAEESSAFKDWHAHEMREARARIPKNRELMLRRRGGDR